ncbi:MAG: NRDE family protein [Sphingomonadales bacterium]|nr:NRDE family protein [Sphingomonadales bacterium]
MCVAAIAWSAHPEWTLVAIGNRDEYHARPAAPLTRWDSGILAGRDLEAGGTWLGVSPGRFALVTNRRAEGYPRAGMASRGGLVTGWLQSEDPGNTAAMNPFNLFTASPGGARLETNFPTAESHMLPPGIHGLSNGGLDERWHKITRLEGALANWLQAGQAPAVLLDALADETPDPADPDNFLSPPFIRNPGYGTRCSSVIAVKADGRGTIIERRFDELGLVTGETELDFVWQT